MNYPATLAIETTVTHGSERIEKVKMTRDTHYIRMGGGLPGDSWYWFGAPKKMRHP
jgi:hypothetical protein